MYIQVNIGRNIGSEPMSDYDWDVFAGRVAFAIYSSANCYEAFDLVTDIDLHDGHGSWNGVPEDSRHISSYWEDGFDLDQLRELLGEIKTWHSQESVALIVGSELI